QPHDQAFRHKIQGSSVSTSMDFLERLTDAELLARTAGEPKAFACFYRRHERLILRFLLARTRDPELTADLAAATFATALQPADRFDASRAGGVSAVPWLLAIARNTLLTSVRRGIVADDARRRLGCEPLALDDEALARVERRASPELPLERLL